jgi:hypothetical protein
MTEKTLLDSKFVDIKLVDGKLQLIIELDAKVEVEKLAAKQTGLLKTALEALAHVL